MNLKKKFLSCFLLSFLEGLYDRENLTSLFVTLKTNLICLYFAPFMSAPDRTFWIKERTGRSLKAQGELMQARIRREKQLHNHSHLGGSSEMA